MMTSVPIFDTEHRKSVRLTCRCRAHFKVSLCGVFDTENIRIQAGRLRTPNFFYVKVTQSLEIDSMRRTLTCVKKGILL